MTVAKLSVSFDPELGEAVKAAAEQDDASVSAWLADAARARLRTLALGAVLRDVLEEEGLSEEQVLDAAASARSSARVVR